MLSTTDLESLIAVKRLEIEKEKIHLGLSADTDANHNDEQNNDAKICKKPVKITNNAVSETNDGTAAKKERDAITNPYDLEEHIPPDLERYIRRYIGLPVMLKAGEYSPNNPLIRGERHTGDVLLALGEYERRRNTLRKLRQQQYKDYLDQQANKKQEAKEQAERERREREEKERLHEERERERLLLERERRSPVRRPSLNYNKNTYTSTKVDTGVQVNGFRKPLSVAVQTDDAELYRVPLWPGGCGVTQAERELSPRAAAEHEHLAELEPHYKPSHEPCHEQNRVTSHEPSNEQYRVISHESRQEPRQEQRHDPYRKPHHVTSYEPHHKPSHELPHESRHEQRSLISHEPRHEPHHKPSHEPRHEQHRVTSHEPHHKSRHEPSHEPRHEQHRVTSHEPTSEPRPERRHSRSELPLTASLVKRTNQEKLLSDLRHSFMPSIFDADAIEIRNMQAEKEAAERRQFYQQELKNQIMEQQRIKEERKSREKLLEQAEMRRLEEQLRMLRVAQDRELSTQLQIQNKMTENATDYNTKRTDLQKEIDSEQQKLSRVKQQTRKKYTDNPTRLPPQHPRTDKQKPYSINISDNLFSPDYDVDSYLRKNLNYNIKEKNQNYLNNDSKGYSPVIDIPILKHSPMNTKNEENNNLSDAMKKVDCKWKVPAVQKNILKSLNDEGKNISILTQLGSIRRQLQLEQLKLDQMAPKHDA